MPINAKPEYLKLELEYPFAKTVEEKLRILQKMIKVAPSHKGAEKLRSGIKQKISKYKKLLEKEKKSKKGSKGFSIKKEGAAQVTIIGVTNSGKSTLLSRITNAKPKIADYEFTTKKPEVGTMNYKGIVVQIVELPAITENSLEKEHGPAFWGIARDSDLIIITDKDTQLIKQELEDAEIENKKITINPDINIEKSKEIIWKNLDLIYVYTKSLGKEKDQPPVALQKKSTVKDLTIKVHKDFLRNFDYAKVWGPSAKHPAMRVGLNHKLKEEDVIEIHTK